MRCLGKLSSSWPESQEWLDGAEAAGLSCRFRSICQWGHRWGNDQPWAPQTVRLSHRWRSAIYQEWICHRVSYSMSNVLSGSQGQVCGFTELFDCLWCQATALIHLFEDIRLVGLEDGHSVEGHACLTSHNVGLPDKGGRGPTWFGWKEGAGLPWRCQRWWEVRG